MISSRLADAWILLVTACRFCWNVSLSARTASPTGPPGSTLIMTQASQLENVVALEHLRLALGDPHPDLLHDEIGFARLQMGDVDLRHRGQFRELFRKQARAQMLGCHREVALAVRKRGLDDEIAQVRDLV